MPETTFESVLATQIRSLAQGGVRPVDRYAIADATSRPASLAVGRRWPVAAPPGIGGSPRKPASPSSWCSRCSRPRSCSRWVPAAGPSCRRSRSRRTRRHLRPRRRPRRAVTRPTGSLTVDPPAPSTDGIGAMDIVAVNAAGQERVVRRLGAELVEGGGAISRTAPWDETGGSASMSPTGCPSCRERGCWSTCVTRHDGPSSSGTHR